MANGSPLHPSRIRILVVDDHPMLREGIVAIIEAQPDMTVVGEGSDGAEAVTLYAQLKPDVILMDIQMPELDGVQAIERVRALSPSAAIIVLTTYPGDAQALRALRAGASGYLLKSCIRKDLLDTIRSVHSGRKVVTAEVAQEIALHASEETLTDREREVLRHLAQGAANKEIARLMSVSPNTVKADLKDIFIKLDVVDRTRAVVVAAKRGIIDL